MHWFLDPIKHQYADFSGRTARKPFWMFTLVYMVLYLAAELVLYYTQSFIVSALFVVALLAILIPSIAITTRRLHDIGKSGWWQLIGLVPFIGFIVMIYFLVKDSVEDNQYGANPKGSMIEPGVAEAVVTEEAPAPDQNQVS